MFNWKRCDRVLKRVLKGDDRFASLRDFCQWYYENYVETSYRVSSSLALETIRYCSNRWNAIEEGDTDMLEKYCPLLASAQNIFYSTNAISEDIIRSKSIVLITRVDGSIVSCNYDWRTGRLLLEGLIT